MNFRHPLDSRHSPLFSFFVGRKRPFQTSTSSCLMHSSCSSVSLIATGATAVAFLSTPGRIALYANSATFLFEFGSSLCPHLRVKSPIRAIPLTPVRNNSDHLFLARFVHPGRYCRYVRQWTKSQRPYYFYNTVLLYTGCTCVSHM